MTWGNVCCVQSYDSDPQDRAHIRLSQVSVMLLLKTLSTILTSQVKSSAFSTKGPNLEVQAQILTESHWHYRHSPESVCSLWQGVRSKDAVIWLSPLVTQCLQLRTHENDGTSADCYTETIHTECLALYLSKHSKQRTSECNEGWCLLLSLLLLQSLI